MNGHQLERLATVGTDGPHVEPVGFRYNPEADTIDIGGRNFSKSKKFRDMQADPRISFVIEDVLPPVAGMDATFIRIVINKIISWGIDGDAYQPYSRTVTK